MVSEVGWLVFVYSLLVHLILRTPMNGQDGSADSNSLGLASGLSEEGDERQVSTLLYSMGKEAEDILRSTERTCVIAFSNVRSGSIWSFSDRALDDDDDERKVYQTVLDKFDQFFKVRKNVIFERAKFNRRCQEITNLQSSSSPASIQVD